MFLKIFRSVLGGTLRVLDVLVSALVQIVVIALILWAFANLTDSDLTQTLAYTGAGRIIIDVIKDAVKSWKNYGS